MGFSINWYFYIFSLLFRRIIKIRRKQMNVHSVNADSVKYNVASVGKDLYT